MDITGDTGGDTGGDTRGNVGSNTSKSRSKKKAEKTRDTLRAHRAPAPVAPHRNRTSSTASSAASLRGADQDDDDDESDRESGGGGEMKSSSSSSSSNNNNSNSSVNSDNSDDGKDDVSIGFAPYRIDNACTAHMLLVSQVGARALHGRFVPPLSSVDFCWAEPNAKTASSTGKTMGLDRLLKLAVTVQAMPAGSGRANYVQECHDVMDGLVHSRARKATDAKEAATEAARGAGGVQGGGGVGGRTSSKELGPLHALTSADSTIREQIMTGNGTGEVGHTFLNGSSGTANGANKGGGGGGIGSSILGGGARLLFGGVQMVGNTASSTFTGIGTGIGASLSAVGSMVGAGGGAGGEAKSTATIDLGEASDGTSLTSRALAA